ncbi:NUDIX domain-containing protein, partial [Stenotrophomonas sp. 3diitr2024]|uniref:NUDIX domain-containing protein n=1 Tax=Stenotrophomonas sp. 3diitr2024 TaxID=3345115 RepID=UPI0035C95FE5
AVITDARGRVLLNRRTENRDMAGLWEFPGGKRESGETSDDVLGVVSLAEQGIGICQSYAFIVQERLQRGQLVEGANRQKTPNEIALTLLLAAMTLTFLVVVATLPAIGA